MKISFANRNTVNVEMFQYDYGQALEIKGLILPKEFEVHYQNGTSIPVTVKGTFDDKEKVGTVAIPDECLQQDVQQFKAWLWVSDEKSGKTIKIIRFYLQSREKPSNVPPVSNVPEIKSYADYVKENADKVKRAEQIGKDLLTKAENGEFNGKEGPKGEKGVKGDPGKDAIVNGKNILNIKAGNNITIDEVDDNIIINGSNSVSGINKYSELPDKPQINGLELIGNKSSKDLGLQSRKIYGKSIWIGDSLGQGTNNNDYSYIDVANESGLFEEVLKCAQGGSCVGPYQRGPWAKGTSGWEQIEKNQDYIKQCDYVFFEFGGNDWSAVSVGNITIGKHTDEAGKNTVCGWFKKCFDRIFELNSKTYVTFIDLIGNDDATTDKLLDNFIAFCATVNEPIDKTKYKKAWHEWNKECTLIFEEYNISRVYAYNTNYNFNLKTMDALLTTDHVHPNDEGHKRIFRNLMQFPITSNQPKIQFANVTMTSENTGTVDISSQQMRESYERGILTILDIDASQNFVLINTYGLNNAYVSVLGTNAEGKLVVHEIKIFGTSVTDKIHLLSEPKVPTKTSELENDSQFVNAQQVLEAIYKLVSPYIVVNSMQGDSFTIPDCSNFKLQNLKIFGKTIQDGVPTPEKPVPLISVGYNGKVPVKVDEISIDIPTLNGGINGVPVPQGGNYIFNNKRWLCDEIDLKKGVRIQRIGRFTFNGSENWMIQSVNSHGIVNFQLKLDNVQEQHVVNRLVCNRFKYQNTVIADTKDEGILISYAVNIRIKNSRLSTVEAFKKWLKANPVELAVPLVNPVETPLTEETKNLLTRLTTKYPQTKVSNTYVAGLEATYVADTKNYIDNKNKPIKQAIIESI